MGRLGCGCWWPSRTSAACTGRPSPWPWPTCAPAIEVCPASLAELGPELPALRPRTCGCSRPGGEYPGGRARWVEIPHDDEATYDKRLAQVCLDGEHWETEGPSLAELLRS
jgi:hypothetical protein